MHEKAGPQCCPFDDIELPASPANELSKLLIDAGDAVTRQENCDSLPCVGPLEGEGSEPHFHEVADLQPNVGGFSSMGHNHG